MKIKTLFTIGVWPLVTIAIAVFLMWLAMGENLKTADIFYAGQRGLLSGALTAVIAYALEKATRSTLLAAILALIMVIIFGAWFTIHVAGVSI